MARRRLLNDRKNAHVLVFTAAGQRFGVFIAEVNRLVVEERTAPVPFSHPALAGLLDSEEADPVPVFDLEGLVDPARLAEKARGARVALFEADRGPVGLRLDAMEGSRADYTFLSDMDATREKVATLPGPLQAPVTAVGQTAEGRDFFFFSPEAFLHALDLGAPERPDSDLPRSLS